MKNIYAQVVILSFLLITMKCICLETPQTPDINLESKELKETVTALKNEQKFGQKVLGTHSKLKEYAEQLKTKLDTFFNNSKNLSQDKINTLKKEITDVSEKIEQETNEL